MRNRRILVPLEVPEEAELCPAITGLLSSMDVVLLGFCIVPKQTDPEQVREKFEEESQEKLDEMVAELERSDAKVVSRLVFTHDRMQSIDRVADEEECGVLLIPGEYESCDRILVAIQSGQDLENISSLVSDLVKDGDRTATLLYIAKDEEEAKKAQSILQDAKDMMEREGIESSSVDLKLVISDDEAKEIGEESISHDILLGIEGKPSLAKLIKGEFTIGTEKSKQTLVVIRSEEQ